MPQLVLGAHPELTAGFTNVGRWAVVNRRWIVIDTKSEQRVGKFASRYGAMVFAERLKRSGMTWGREGGQVILDLRVLVLSRVWQPVHSAYLSSRPQPTAVQQASHGEDGSQNLTNAA